MWAEKCLNSKNIYMKKKTYVRPQCNQIVVCTSQLLNTSGQGSPGSAVGGGIKSGAPKYDNPFDSSFGSSWSEEEEN